MGSVAFQPWMMELVEKGEPVGELVQWTNIIAALYVLGHDVKVVSNETQLPYGPFVPKIWMRMGIKALDMHSFCIYALICVNLLPKLNIVLFINADMKVAIQKLLSL